MRNGQMIYFCDSGGNVVESNYVEGATELFVGELGSDWFLSPEEAKMAYGIEMGSFIKNCGNCEAVNQFKECDPCNSCRQFGSWQLKIWQFGSRLQSSKKYDIIIYK